MKVPTVRRAADPPVVFGRPLETCHPPELRNEAGNSSEREATRPLLGITHNRSFDPGRWIHRPDRTNAEVRIRAHAARKNHQQDVVHDAPCATIMSELFVHQFSIACSTNLCRPRVNLRWSQRVESALGGR